MEKAANNHLKLHFNEFIDANCCCSCCPRASEKTHKTCSNKRCPCRKGRKVCETCDARCQNMTPEDPDVTLIGDEIIQEDMIERNYSLQAPQPLFTPSTVA